eukprot:NODE_4405_length_805_cov_9.510582_g3651_i0.p1 GENE.NODE_4405_length_805_cov_9.510582_g3651_i0~~NODE_4405_length_805_cov_9.510582_g3651_i0.p1  ORF type:complete len:226 (+),score=7.95 NODE_4405_length_805_cov_9.510582_g3651_i0:93-680(+)
MNVLSFPLNASSPTRVASPGSLRSPGATNGMSMTRAGTSTHLDASAASPYAGGSADEALFRVSSSQPESPSRSAEASSLGLISRHKSPTHHRPKLWGCVSPPSQGHTLPQPVHAPTLPVCYGYPSCTADIPHSTAEQKEIQRKDSEVFESDGDHMARVSSLRRCLLFLRASVARTSCCCMLFLRQMNSLTVRPRI